MSWQAYINDTTDGHCYPDWLAFEKAFNLAVKAGAVPPSAQITLRKAPSAPRVERPALMTPEQVSAPPPVRSVTPDLGRVERHCAAVRHRAKRDTRVALLILFLLVFCGTFLLKVML